MRNPKPKVEDEAVNYSGHQLLCFGRWHPFKEPVRGLAHRMSTFERWVFNTNTHSQRDVAVETSAVAFLQERRERD